MPPRKSFPDLDAALKRRRGLRAFAVAAVLVAVCAASVVDGEASDLVGGDQGDASVTLRRDEAGLSAACAPRTSDSRGATRLPGFLAAPSSAPPLDRNATSAAEAPSVPSARRLGSAEPLASRAPPLG